MAFDADGNPLALPATSVSMEDFTNLKTSMETKMDELREMIAKLSEAKVTASPPSLEIPQVELKENEDKEDPGVDQNKNESPSKTSNGKGEHARVPFAYSPDLPIPHPPIHLRGAPPSLNASSFTRWQSSMKSHLKSGCIGLWKIIVDGFKPVNENDLTMKEEVEAQLNSTALDVIRVAVGEKNIHHIEDCTTAKEAWDSLTEVFVGNDSMRRNRYEAMSNQIEGFYKKDDETHEEMYQRLKALATAFRDLGAKHVDDTYIKRKYVNALMPFEEADLKSLQGKHNYDTLTSNEVMQEMQSYKVQAQIARDSRARALGMARSSSLALKAKVVEQD